MNVDGSLVFWLICLGSLVGGVCGFFFKGKGRGPIANIMFGALGAIIAGLIGQATEIGASIAFGVMGTASFLVLFNVFCYVNEPATGDDRDLYKI